MVVVADALARVFRTGAFFFFGMRCRRSTEAAGLARTPCMRIRVLAVPNSKSNEVLGWEDDPRAGRVLRVKVTAPPVEGKANAALRECLAGHLKIARSQVTLEKGDSSRIKTFTVPDGSFP